MVQISTKDRGICLFEGYYEGEFGKFIITSGNKFSSNMGSTNTQADGWGDLCPKYNSYDFPPQWMGAEVTYKINWLIALGSDLPA